MAKQHVHDLAITRPPPARSGPVPKFADITEPLSITGIAMPDDITERDCNILCLYSAPGSTAAWVGQQFNPPLDREIVYTVAHRHKELHAAMRARHDLVIKGMMQRAVSIGLIRIFEALASPAACVCNGPKDLKQLTTAVKTLQDVVERQPATSLRDRNIATVGTAINRITSG